MVTLISLERFLNEVTRETRGTFVEEVTRERRPSLTVEPISDCRCVECEGKRRDPLWKRGEAFRLDRMKAEEEAATQLTKILGAAALDGWLRHGEFEVTGSLGGRYRLLRGSFTGNVRLYDPSRDRWGTMCIHLCTADQTSMLENILGQVLMITTNERRFLQLAY